MVKKIINSIIRVVLYIRVSTDRQSKEGDSLEAQETALRKYAKEKGYKVVGVYIDGGESGQKLKRTNLQRMLNDISKNEVDMILITKLDRWFRSISDFYKVQEIIKKYNVNWKTIWEDYDTTTASGEFWLNMSLSMGQLEAKRTGERIEAIFDHKYRIQKTVCTGNVAYGYKISNDKKLIIDEERAKHINKLFDYYIASNNLLQTTRWFQTNCCKKSFGSIKLYLKNRIYIGEFIRKKTGEVLKDYAPQIIDKEKFEIVQQLLQKNVKNNHRNHNDKPYIFSGLLKCGECGKNYSGLYSGRDHLHYYRCKKAYESVYCKNKLIIKEDTVEKYVINNIVDILQKRKIEIDKIDENKEKEKSDTSAIKKKMNKLTDLYVNDLIDIDYYKNEYEELKLKLKNEETKTISNNKFDSSIINNILKDDFLKIYTSLDNLEKRRLLSSVIDYIEIKGKNDIEIVVY